jgi:hypothetical protein
MDNNSMEMLMVQIIRIIVRIKKNKFKNKKKIKLN